MKQEDFKSMAEQSCLAVAYWNVAKDFLIAHDILTISNSREFEEFVQCMGMCLRFHYIEPDGTVPLYTANSFIKQCIIHLVEDDEDLPVGLTIRVTKYADKTGGFDPNSYWIEHYKTTGKYGQHFVYLHEEECYPSCIDWRKVTFGGID